MTMRPAPDDLHAPDAPDAEADDLVARARAAVLEMRRQAAASGLDAVSEDAGPDDGRGEDAPAPKTRRKKRGAARRAA